MIRQPNYYVKHNALYCVCCATGGSRTFEAARSAGYHPIYENPPVDTLECVICQQPIMDWVKDELEHLIRVVSAI